MRHPKSKTCENIDTASGYPVMQIRLPRILAKFMKFTCWAFKMVGVLVAGAKGEGFLLANTHSLGKGIIVVSASVVVLAEPVLGDRGKSR